MALTAITAAQLNFKHNIDHIWHIYTPEEVSQRAKDGKMMHAAPGDRVNLIEIPFVPWKTYFSTAHDADELDARAMLRSQVREAEDYKRCRRVEQSITKAQHKVLRAFADGKTPKEVAEHLYVSPSTVSTHLSVIFDECRSAWGYPDKHALDYHFLREKFAWYFLRDE